jgi:hypothetical protein
VSADVGSDMAHKSHLGKVYHSQLYRKWSAVSQGILIGLPLTVQGGRGQNRGLTNPIHPVTMRTVAAPFV